MAEEGGEASWNEETLIPQGATITLSKVDRILIKENVNPR